MNYYDELMQNDEDFKHEYDKNYSEALKREFDSIEDEDERDEVYSEMKKITYQPTSNPKSDAELNMLKAKENLRKSRKANRNPATESFLSHIAKQDGVTKNQARKKYKKAMEDSDRTGLSKYGF